MAKKQYPPQQGPVIVKVKSGQSTDNWQNFATARFQISVGQEYHEADKLNAVVAWSKERFDKVIFCANDTLQRFNLMYEQSISEQEANMRSADLGQEWVKRNLSIIETAKTAQIVRWDEWKTKPKYPKGFLQTEWLYQNNNEFKQAIDDNVVAIWERRQKHDAALYNPERFEEFVSLSRRYLIEEMATFALMYAEEKAIDIYPGTTLFAATKFRGRSLEGAPEGLGQGHFCRIDFAKLDQ